jgi:hypothetical protein
LNQPHLAETPSQHPTPLWPSPCPPWTPQPSLHATVHLPRCHQACLEPLNQFPEMESLERVRASRPDHTDMCQFGRPVHAERATAFPCTPTSPGLAMHAR